LYSLFVFFKKTYPYVKFGGNPNGKDRKDKVLVTDNFLLPSTKGDILLILVI